jgi:hypothetical protein
LARGLSMGTDVTYADKQTLSRAVNGRTPLWFFLKETIYIKGLMIIC